MEGALLKLFILGHGDHGKGTAAEIICELTGMTAGNSSWFACQRYIWPRIQQREPGRYANALECFNDRRNHRTEWYEAIKRITARDPARLAREIFEQFDIYDGPRDIDEFKASNHLADLSIWIDASKRKPLESSDSMTIPRSLADVIIDNNDTVDQLRRRLSRLCSDWDFTPY